MVYMGVRAFVGVWAWLSLVGVIPNTLSTQVESTGVLTLQQQQQNQQVQQVVGVSRNGVASCPARCACFGTTVDCAKRGLTRLPRGIPSDTQR
ncbi:hypothetical protein SK128_015139, partial [Halocaridina rubra]